MTTPGRSVKRSMGIDAIAAFGAAAVTALVGAAVVIPMSQGNALNESLNQRHTEALKRCDEASAIERDLKATVAATAEQLARNRVKPAPLSSLNRKVAEITDLAASSGLILEQLGPGDTYSTAAARSVSIKASGLADLGAWRRFLSAMHDQHPDTAITEFTLADLSAAETERSALSGSVRTLPQTPATAAFTMAMVWHAAPSTQVNVTEPKNR